VVDGKTLYWGQDRQHFVVQDALHSKDDDLYFEQKGKPMARTLEIYWDFSSPYAYLGSTQAKKLADRTGATLVWKPMLLGGLFKAIGQVDFPLASFGAAKQKYYADDMKRWAAYWGVPYVWPSRFPLNTVKALRVYLALPEARRDAFREKTFEAFWGQDRDISSDAVLSELIGADASAILAQTQEPAIKQELIACTEAAAKAGVFGAPTWIVDGKELFWGQDRLPLVERALLG
jgi:2-hydroxychromene-2-carboxylate isomerase